MEQEEDPLLRKEAAEAAVEIGISAVEATTVDTVNRRLEEVPPLPFDVTRQVRVFQPYIQYVEISLVGCDLERRKIRIPKSIMGLAGRKEIENRLKTTFDLIEKESGLTAESLKGELDQLRNHFTRSLPKPWGRVLLRARRPDFDKRIEDLRDKLAKHQDQVRKKLEKYLEKSLKQVVQYFAPIAQKKPPEALAGQLLSSKPTKAQVEAWLSQELSSVFPKVDQLSNKMSLDVLLRDVTYETLCESGFAQALRDAFPHVEWDRPFKEFTAAGERTPEACLFE